MGNTTRRRSFRKAGIVSLSLVAVLGLFASACSSSDDSSSNGGTTKAAWIYVGPINDGGWTTAHNAGREFASTVLGA